MKNRLLGLLFALLACAALPGQTQDGVTATLTTESDLVKMGTIELTLTVDVAEDTELDAAVLNGMSLAVKVEGEDAGILSEGQGSGKTMLAAGTRIQRRLSVDLEKAGVRLRDTELTAVSFVWPGLQGASTLIRVAPDVREVAIEDMDLTKTRVMLSTSLGEMTLAFFPDEAPNHVANFLRLAQADFYDGTRFHRILSGFMVQGGCPETKDGATGLPGSGGPGWTVPAEFNDIKHVRGILSMARSSDPNSAGSQFFLVHGQASHLDGQYSAFGSLDGGFDTLDRIASVPVAGPEPSTPLEPVYLYFAVVLPVLKTSP
jgi:peptidyl-prolyl cis-trans isomerase B (cyclophilin B)